MAAPRVFLVASMTVLLCVASCTSTSEEQGRTEREAGEEKPPPLNQQSDSQSESETPSVSEDAVNGDPVNEEAAQSSEQEVKEQREEKEEVKKERYIHCGVCTRLPIKVSSHAVLQGGYTCRQNPPFIVFVATE